MRKILSLILVITLAGCTDGLGTGLGTSVRGTYQLETVNGRFLPYTFTSYNGARVTIFDGEIRLGSDGRFTEVFDVEDDFGFRSTDRYDGDYETRSGDVVLYYDSGETVDAEYNSRELRVYGEGLTMVYRR